MSHRGRYTLTSLAFSCLALACLFLLSGCNGEPRPTDADVLVIGGGIAGLSAALEASATGAQVLVIETSSVAGGHAIKAGGLALVGTPLQERKGFNDTPDMAYRDLMAWGEDPNPEWVRLFVDSARREIHDWLADFGVKFTILIDTPEDTVPRFHFAGGGATRVVVPMLREAVARTNLNFVMNAEAQHLSVIEDELFQLQIRDSRTGAHRQYIAPAVVIATGGFQSNLDLVRENFRTDTPALPTAPELLLIGSGQYATGAGLQLGQDVNAQLTRMDRQVMFVNGLADPRDPQRGLTADNPAAIRVTADGRRFVNEAADSKSLESAVMSLDRRMHWLVFDSSGRKQLRIRGAVWLSRDTLASEILGNPKVTHRANTIAALATAAGLPAGPLQATLERYNNMVETGEDLDFGRFDSLSKKTVPKIQTIATPPFYAIRLLPMTRKSMGGLAIDINAQVTGPDDQPIAGLFAAGEATGVAGINGSHGGSGTFLAPSVLTGRIAGRNAAASVQYANSALRSGDPAPSPSFAPAKTENSIPLMSADDLRALLKSERAGYWHWARSHATVLERELACTDCHSRDWPTMPAMTTNQELLKLDSCIRCH